MPQKHRPVEVVGGELPKMKASEIMTLGVYTVRPEASLKEAANLMRERGISGLPVVDKMGRLVGVVTEGDLLRRVETGTENADLAGWNFYWARDDWPTNTCAHMPVRFKTS